MTMTTGSEAQPELAPVAAQVVPPSPVPTTISLGQVQSIDGSMLVVMQVTTPVGLSVFFLDGDTARRIGQGLVKTGKASHSGLVVPH